MTPRNRRRLQLILIFGIFAVPALAALLLGGIGWQPGTRSAGEPVLPQRGVADVVVTLDDGTSWPWRDSEPRMTLLALPGPDCAAACSEMLALMRNARVTLNRNMQRLRLLYVGTPPTDAAVLQGWRIGRDESGAFDAFRAQTPDSVAALLVESNGTVLLHYPAGFDPRGLARDLRKVVR